MIEAVIFDLDGVIVSTDELHYQAWRALADKEGIYFDKIINNRLRGVSRVESLEIILENSQKLYSNEEKIELANFKNNIYRDLLEELTPDDILPDVNLVIRSLRKMELKLAIGSSSKNCKKILTQIGLQEVFDVIVDGNDITYSKPNPEVFQLAAKKLNVKPEKAIVVEDAIAGIEAAYSGGFKSVAINDATNCELADYKLKNLHQLLDVIETIKLKGEY
jgi:beta-phosphoglucomutase